MPRKEENYGSLNSISYGVETSTLSVGLEGVEVIVILITIIIVIIIIIIIIIIIMTITVFMTHFAKYRCAYSHHKNIRQKYTQKP